MTDQKLARKLSWQYDDLSKKIQCPKHLVAKLVLRHLGSSANDKGQSHHGYISIAAYCSVTRSKVSPALQYLRDDLKIVTWVKGVGGIKSRDTNLYQLDLAAMKNLIKVQGVFDPKTGKLIRVESEEPPKVESPEGTGLQKKSKPLRAHDKSKSSPLTPRVESPEGSITLSVKPPEKSNPQISTMEVGEEFFSKGKTALRKEGVGHPGLVPLKERLKNLRSSRASLAGYPTECRAVDRLIAGCEAEIAALEDAR